MTEMQEYVQSPIENIKETVNTNIDITINKIDKLKKRANNFFKKCWSATKGLVVSVAKSSIKPLAGFAGTVGGLIALATSYAPIGRLIGETAPHLLVVANKFFGGMVGLGSTSLLFPTGPIAGGILIAATGLSAASIVTGTVRRYRSYKFNQKEDELQKINHKIACMNKCLQNNPAYQIAKDRMLQELNEKIQNKNIEAKLKDAEKDNGPSWLALIPGVGNTLDVLWQKFKKSPVKPALEKTGKILNKLYQSTIGFVWDLSISPKNYAENKLKQEKTELYLSEMEKMQNSFIATLTKEEQQKIFKEYQKELAKPVVIEQTTNTKAEEPKPTTSDIEYIRNCIEDGLKEVKKENNKNISLDIKAIEKIAETHKNQEIIDFINAHYPKDQNGVHQNTQNIKEEDVTALYQIAFKAKIKDVLKLIPKISVKHQTKNNQSKNLTHLKNNQR